MRLFKTPFALRMFYPSFLWKMPEGKKKIYLTFDDGPHHSITPQVLELLKKNNAKATFFCVGNNIEINKDIFMMILKEGHSVGNHTYNHEKGWDTDIKAYIDSVDKTQKLIDSLTEKHNHTPLLRPPHGRIKPSQIRMLKKHYKIIAWSVISYDWDKSLNPDKCYEKIIEKAADGSIIVFHDSEKAYKNMIPTLTQVIEYYSKKGYSFEKL